MQHQSHTSHAARLEQIASELFFIVGCGRSGTSLMQAIFNSHPEIVTPPETRYAAKFPRRMPQLRDLSDPAAFAKAIDAVIDDQHRQGLPFDEARFTEYAQEAPRTWDGLLLALLAVLAERDGRSESPRVGEKSPAHTPFVGRLSESFPKAKFIHIIRDPRAVMLSRIRARFTAGEIGAEIPRWREAVQMHREHAQRLGPDRYLLLRYEDLVSDLEPTVRSLCAFLDIEMRPEMLEPHKRPSKGFNPRSEVVMKNTLKPVFTGSIDKWRTELSTAQIAMIEHALADEMREMEYKPIGARTTAPALRLALSMARGRAEYTRRKVFGKARQLAGLKPPPPRPPIDA